MKERWKFLLLAGLFALFYVVPLGELGLGAWLSPGLALLHEYAREHVLTCLVPAFFIAGAIAVYLNKDAVLKYLGPTAKALVSYPLASLSGGVLAVCSCTVLPLFAGIYKRGAGLGPAVAFVFTGPAINITAIFLTVSVLGWQFAAFRLAAAMTIAIVSGLIMAALFEQKPVSSPSPQGWLAPQAATPPAYSGGTMSIFLGSQVGVLVLLGVEGVPLAAKVILTLAAVAAVAYLALLQFRKADRQAWMQETWTFTKQIMPYLFVGVFLAGLITALMPPDVVARLVGGNGVAANALASVSGAVMYFATLTEIPILQSLLKLGMGTGPAMALLLTGNAVSLPNLLVLNKILGRQKTITYLALTVSMSIVAGLLFGMLTG